MKTLIIGISVYLFSFMSIYAQEGLRYEINAEKYNHVVHIPLGGNGILTLQHNKESRKNLRWSMVHLNKNLVEKWNKDLNIDDTYIPVEYVYEKDSIVHIFFRLKKGKSSFKCYSVNTSDGSFSTHTFVGSGKLNLAHYEVMDKSIMAAGITQPNGLVYTAQALYTLTLIPVIFNHKLYSISPKVYIYNKVSKVGKMLEPDLSGSCEILATGTDLKRNRFIVLIKQLKRKQSFLHWIEYDELGKEQKRLLLDSLNQQNILSADISITSENNALIIGTYNQTEEKRRNTSQTYTHGVFISKISDGISVFEKFHPYKEMTNAFKYLNPNQMVRYMDRKSKGKKTQIGFDLYMHPKVIVNKGEYILLGELYYPEYHMESTYDVRGYWMYEEVFDGYNFTHAIAISMDEKGDLKWDNIMKMENVFSYNIRENVLLHTETSQQVLLYYQDGKIYSKGINGNQVLFKERDDELKYTREGEAVVVENNGLIFPWYNSYFMVTGYQEIETVKGKRKVFFISKIGFM